MRFIIFIFLFPIFISAQTVRHATESYVIDSIEAVNSLIDKQSTNTVYVTDKSDLLGSLSSTSVYYVLGAIDMGTDSILVPTGGLNVLGLGFGVSSISSTNTMFYSSGGGSGDLFLTNIEIVNSGKVFNLTDIDGTHAVEMNTVNFNDCSSLGTLNGYRQGLENNTGRFGGSPTLTLDGNWAGGYRAVTTITRGVTNCTQYKAGASFLMNNRFLTDINYLVSDVGNSFCDFSPINIANDGDFQIKNGEWGGLSGIASYFPNMPISSSKSYFNGNTGIRNSIIGGRWDVSGELQTTIATSDTFKLLGTKTFSKLVHFDDSSGEIRYKSTKEREFNVFADLSISGTSGDLLTVFVRVFDDSEGIYNYLSSIVRPVENLVGGGSDRATFFIYEDVVLNENDRVEFWIKNETGTNDVTLQSGSFLRLVEI